MTTDSESVLDDLTFLGIKEKGLKGLLDFIMGIYHRAPDQKRIEVWKKLGCGNVEPMAIINADLMPNGQTALEYLIGGEDTKFGR